MDRAFTFRNPKIIQRLCDDFIPYAGNVEELQPQLGYSEFACQQWYMNMATQSKALSMQGATTQGTYIAGADGTVYSWKNASGISAQLHFMEQGMKAFKEHPPAQVAIPETALQAAFTRPPRSSTSVVAIYSRIRPLPACADSRNRDLGRDYLWIYQDEVRQILRESEKFKVNQKIPQTLAYRIARYHFIDIVRGQPIFWQYSEVTKADFTLKKVSEAPEHPQFTFEGAIECHSSSGESGIRGTISGKFTIDELSEKIVTFRAYGKSEAWGASEYTKMGAPKDHFPLVFGFIETTDENSQVTPPGAVAQSQHYRHPDKGEGSITIRSSLPGAVTASSEQDPAVERIASGVTEDLLSISVTGNSLIAVGNRGTMVRSDDDGAHWKSIDSGTDATLRSVQFLNKDFGLAVGDGGNYKKELMTEHHILPRGIELTEELKKNPAKLIQLLAVADGPGIPSTVLKTVDGGATWRRIAVMTNFPLTDLHIIDAKRVLLLTGDIAEGMTTHDGDILASNDGGETWHAYLRALGGANYKIALDDAGNGIVVRQDILRSAHKKKPTEEELMATAPMLREGLRTLNDPNVLWITKFGGDHWNNARAPIINDKAVASIKVPGCRDLYGACIQANKVWACGKGGAIVAANLGQDKPTDWELKISSTNNDLVGIAFVDGTIGFAVGKSGTCEQTTDGGATWNARRIGVPADLKAIAFGQSHVVIVGAHGLVLRLPIKNGGKN